MTVPYRRAMLLAVAIFITVACASLPPIAQDQHYHSFASSGALWGIPNFWNVVSNIPFSLAAIYGLSAFRNRSAFTGRWEGIAFAITIAGTAAVAGGSAWYHLNPTDYTLLWDRLPMTVVFTALLAATIGERVDSQSGRRLLFPLLGLGILSVLDCRITGDLRAYAGVQFGSAITIAFLLAMFPGATHDPANCGSCSPSTRLPNSRNSSTGQSPLLLGPAGTHGNTYWLRRRSLSMRARWRVEARSRAFYSAKPPLRPQNRLPRAPLSDKPSSTRGVSLCRSGSVANCSLLPSRLPCR